MGVCLSVSVGVCFSVSVGVCLSVSVGVCLACICGSVCKCVLLFVLLLSSIEDFPGGNPSVIENPRDIQHCVTRLPRAERSVLVQFLSSSLFSSFSLSYSLFVIEFNTGKMLPAEEINSLFA